MRSSDGKYCNYYLAWNKTIFEKHVIEHMRGNFKRVYEYVKNFNLNPIIEYWSNDSDEGFQIVIEW